MIVEFSSFIIGLIGLLFCLATFIDFVRHTDADEYDHDND